MAEAETAGRKSPYRPDSDAVREVISSVGGVAQEKARQLADLSRVKLEELKKKSLEELYNDTKSYIRENPGKTLLGALAAGFILGKLLRRR